MGFDRDRSGTVEPHELNQALVSFGYNLSPQAVGVLTRRYGSSGRIAFDAFVALCVRLRMLTSKLMSCTLASYPDLLFSYVLCEKKKKKSRSRDKG